MATRIEKPGLWNRIKGSVAAVTAVTLAALTSGGCPSHLRLGAMDNSLGGTTNYTQPKGYVVGVEAGEGRVRGVVDIEYNESGIGGNPPNVDVNYTRQGIYFGIEGDFGESKKTKELRRVNESLASNTETFQRLMFDRFGNPLTEREKKAKEKAREGIRLGRQNRRKIKSSKGDIRKAALFYTLGAIYNSERAVISDPFDETHLRNDSWAYRTGLGLRLGGFKLTGGAEFSKDMDDKDKVRGFVKGVWKF